MTKKKYAFEGRFGKWLKIPIYVRFDELEVEELENGDYSVKASGVPHLTGRNYFYEILLSLAIKLELFKGEISLFLDDLLKREPKPSGFYFTLDQLIEVGG